VGGVRHVFGNDLLKLFLDGPGIAPIGRVAQQTKLRIEPFPQPCGIFETILKIKRRRDCGMRIIG